jgi:Protein of unknown function (DUF3224)
MTKGKGSFELASWNEETYEELDEGAKLTRASVTQTFEGDITGDGAVQWLMAYRTDGTARSVGFQRVDGSIGGRRGTFVLETVGDFDGKSATWQATVVAGSGTGKLEGLTGQGTFGAQHGPKATFELDCRLE